MVEYPLAKQGVYLTIQGEGAFLGMPMVFIRLAGCPVNCPLCDTDYSVKEHVSAHELVARVKVLAGENVKWVWITGGEPVVYDLSFLVDELHNNDFQVALATSGIKKVQRGFILRGVDWLSVSPHDPGQWVQRSGEQLNLVPSLNGFRLTDFEEILSECSDWFSYKYVTPCEGKPETLQECLDWIKTHRSWRLGIQAHKYWGLP